jgi:hypothetical protein
MGKQESSWTDIHVIESLGKPERFRQKRHLRSCRSTATVRYFNAVIGVNDSRSRAAKKAGELSSYYVAIPIRPPDS